MAVFRVERTRDFTVMSNHHLRNKSLTLKAKGLLSLMLSLPEDWDYTTRGLAAICKENKDTIGKIINELISAGYIIRQQERGLGGQMGKCVYTIYEKPQNVEEISTATPCPKKQDTVFSDTDKPATVEPATAFQDKINKDKTNKQIQKTFVTKSSINQSSGGVIDEKMIDGYRDIIYENISYSILVEQNPHDKELIDEMTEIMLECLTAQGIIRIGSQRYAPEVVRSRMLKINSGHIEYILGCFKENTTLVRNIKAYMKSALYNAATTINSHYSARVQHDLYDKK